MPYIDDPELQALVESIDTLPSMPAVAMQVVRLVQEDNATADDFADVIALDSALSGRLLKLSNSSLYNPGSPVKTLPRAVITLGLKSVKLLALSFSLVDQTPDCPDQPLDLKTYWRRTISRAAAAHTLGGIACRRLVDEGFLCGLLSRIGQLVLATGHPERYQQVLERSSGSWPQGEAEREIFGYSGNEVTEYLLRSWSIPDLICDAVSHADSTSGSPLPDSSGKARDLAQLMQVAAFCEELVCNDNRKGMLEELISLADQNLNLSADEVEDALREVQGRIAETADMLEVQLEPVDTEQIVSEARQQMLTASLCIANEMQHVERIATDLESSNRELRQKVTRDPLTGMANRRCFDQSLNRAVGIRNRKREGPGVGLLMIDIDHFKAVNDDLGHPAGDKVLRAISAAISSVVRDHDLVARYGGEEFATIFAATHYQGFLDAAERIRAVVEETPTEIDGEEVAVTVSVGGAYCPPTHSLKNAWELVSNADKCLYESKDAGRNSCHFVVLGGEV